jgi:hypothetical protein
LAAYATDAAVPCRNRIAAVSSIATYSAGAAISTDAGAPKTPSAYRQVTGNLAAVEIKGAVCINSAA